MLLLGCSSGCIYCVVWLLSHDGDIFFFSASKHAVCEHLTRRERQRMGCVGGESGPARWLVHETHRGVRWLLLQSSTYWHSRDPAGWFRALDKVGFESCCCRNATRVVHSTKWAWRWWGRWKNNLFYYSCVKITLFTFYARQQWHIYTKRTPGDKELNEQSMNVAYLSFVRRVWQDFERDPVSLWL